jgi:hypothetical protein
MSIAVENSDRTSACTLSFSDPEHTNCAGQHVEEGEEGI